MATLKFWTSSKLTVWALAFGVLLISRADQLGPTPRSMTDPAAHAPSLAPQLVSDRYEIPFEQRRTLRTQMSNDALAELLPKLAGATIRVVGRPDDDATNAIPLSRKRAINLKNYLVRHGANAESISWETDTSSNTRRPDGGFPSDVYISYGPEKDDSNKQVTLNNSGPATPKVPAPQPSDLSTQAARNYSTDFGGDSGGGQGSKSLNDPAPSQRIEANASGASVGRDATGAGSGRQTQAVLQEAAAQPPVPNTEVFPTQSASVQPRVQPTTPVLLTAATATPAANVREIQTPSGVKKDQPMEIITGVAIDEQLRKFASRSGWELIWVAPDFLVDRAITLPSDFEAGLTSFLRSANASGTRLRATLYRGNKTVRIEEF